MPVSRISQREPRSATRRASTIVGCSLSMPRRKPCGPSSACSLAVSPLRQPRRDHAVARGQPRMQRLHHRAEVLLQPARRRRGDAERVCVAASSRPSSRAAAAAAPIVPSVEVQCHPRCDSGADSSPGPAGIRSRSRRRRRRARPGLKRQSARRRQSAGTSGAARMRERHEAHVVVIERMRGHAISNRGVVCARLKTRAEHAAGPFAFSSDGVSDDAGRGLRHAGKNHARPYRRPPSLHARACRPADGLKR